MYELECDDDVTFARNRIGFFTVCSEVFVSPKDLGLRRTWRKGRSAGRPRGCVRGRRDNTAHWAAILLGERHESHARLITRCRASPGDEGGRE